MYFYELTLKPSGVQVLGSANGEKASTEIAFPLRDSDLHRLGEWNGVCGAANADTMGKDKHQL